MFKKLMITIIASLLLLVTACSGTDHTGADEQKGTETTKDGQVELRMMWWGDQKRADITNEALKVFQEKHPNIKIVGEFAPSSGYFDKLNTQLASGTAPDIFFLGGNVVDYAKKDVLLNLDPYVGSELNLDGMDATMVDYGRLDGKLQHISAGANARGIVVNQALFDQAGIPLPASDWTWEDYAAISKELSDKLGKGFYGTYNFTVDGMDIFLKQRGKQLYDMKNGTLGFAKEDILEWFIYWEQASKSGGVVTPELQVSNPPDDTSKSLLITGKAAMSLLPSNQLAAFQSLTEDKLILLPVPRGPKGTGVVFESSQGLSGYANTKHAKEVAILMDFWINDPDAAKILGNDRGVPVTEANRNLLQQEAGPVEEIVYNYTSFVSEAIKTEPFDVSYNPPGFAEFSKLAQTTNQEIGFGRKSVEQAVTDFYNGTVRIFESNQ
ncbi:MULTISPECIES: ABC transporter substrate-binding protein [Paenibacillus]|uniref:Carbohydrate ABC transporter substrate-binding protein (CUT1 family) n=1 Tax=Paenibacillus pabuli TaxID=1472 RepID=A0A855XZZ6_9BACL|nr:MULTISPECIES: extracellular solute-binding protein [Paenibacillus]PWW40043.1 carbohydrate ABC transporter substrate-binding protein (CUT1 family) [Paenibacillus pabuli]PXW06491.1 carbohydrate ABC transporter substrate-binding protein (CUT1 family) [Paenibacillus taichungensis]